MIPKSV